MICQRASAPKVPLNCVLNIDAGKQGEVQRSRFRMLRIGCIVMDTRSSCSSVLNHRRIGGPRHCLRHHPQQRKRSCYYSAAGFLMQASPARRRALSQLGPQTKPLPALLSLLSLFFFLCRRQDFKRFARSTSRVLIKPAVIGSGIIDIWKLRCRSSLGF